MSMLAEPRKKLKHTLNPRGTLWANDDDKFGQKLLEKMGWKKGQGLGKEEQGQKEPIRVKAISDKKGIGFEVKGDELSNHYDAFENVLASLNCEELNDENESKVANENIESLEVKSKNSKNRVHYKKFTQSKDLSRYKDDDLACVLGSKKQSNKNTKTDLLQAIGHTAVGEVDSSFGLVSVHGGNLTDYFNRKIEQLRQRREEGILGTASSTTPRSTRRHSAAPDTPVPDLEFEPIKTDFSFNVTISGASENVDGGIHPEECDAGNDVGTDCKKKKGKRSKRKKKDAENVELGNEFDEVHSEGIIREVSTREKKKKKIKKYNKSNSSEENENQLDINSNSSSIRKEYNSKSEKEIEAIEASNSKASKKRKNKMKSEDQMLDLFSTTEDEPKIESIEISSKKRRKKSESLEINEELTTRTSRKSKRKSDNGECLANVISDDKEDNSLNIGIDNTSMKKRKRNLNEVDSNILTENKKSKKKERNHKHIEEQEIFENNNIDAKSKKRNLQVENSIEEIIVENIKGNVKKSVKNDPNLERCRRIKKSNQLNESYLAATSPERKKKRGKIDESVEQMAHHTGDSQNKTSKRLKKFASDVSLIGDLFKSHSNISGPQAEGNSDDYSVSQNNQSNEASDQITRPKKKLTAKRSFKELRAEINDKIKEKIKKRDKKPLDVIEENECEERVESSKNNIVTLKIPRESKSKIFDTRIYNLAKIFPGSNLASIRGYDNH